MKKLMFILIILIIGISTAKAQTLHTVWTNNEGFGDVSDQPTRLVPAFGSIYRNGWKDGTNGCFSAIAKYNQINGATQWSYADTTTLTQSSLPFCVLINKNKVFYNSASLSNIYFYLMIRNATTGQVERIRPVEWRMSLCEYGDSVIGVVTKNPSRVIIFNSNGDSIRGFSLGYSL